MGHGREMAAAAVSQIDPMAGQDLRDLSPAGGLNTLMVTGALTDIPAPMVTPALTDIPAPMGTPALTDIPAPMVTPALTDIPARMVTPALTDIQLCRWITTMDILLTLRNSTAVSMICW